MSWKARVPSQHIGALDPVQTSDHLSQRHDNPMPVIETPATMEASCRF